MQVRPLLGPPFNGVSMFFSKLIEIVKEWFKPAKVTCRVQYVIDVNALNYIKEMCGIEGIPVSKVLLNAIKKGYKFDAKIKSEVLEIFQKEGLVPVILV